MNEIRIRMMNFVHGVVTEKQFEIRLRNFSARDRLIPDVPNASLKER